MENLVYAIVLLPLVGFLINGLFGKHLPKIFVGGLATLVVFASFVITTSLFLGFDKLKTEVPIRISLSHSIP